MSSISICLYIESVFYSTSSWRSNLSLSRSFALFSTAIESILVVVSKFSRILSLLSFIITSREFFCLVTFSSSFKILSLKSSRSTSFYFKVSFTSSNLLLVLEYYKSDWSHNCRWVSLKSSILTFTLSKLESTCLLLFEILSSMSNRHRSSSATFF